MRARGLVLCLLAGCGRIGFDPQGGAARDSGASDSGSVDVALSLDAIQCPPTYGTFATGCYRVMTVGNAGWGDSETSCATDGVGSHLAVPSDAADLAVLQTDVLGSVTNAWIGVSDRITPGVHLTVTGLPAFESWDPGQPTGGTQRCADLGSMNLMKDSPCNNLNDYICEYDGVAADPTAF